MNNGLDHLPEKLAIISRGKSSEKFNAAYENGLEVDQVWATNKMYFDYPAHVDVVWVMDDLKKRIERDDPVFATLLRNQCPLPIVTSRAYPEYMFSCEYPLDEVIVELSDPGMVLNCRTTIDWMLAYLFTSTLVQEIHFFGLDGAFQTVDPQRHACTYGWLFALSAAGVKLHFQPESAYYEFFNGQVSHERGLYGYDPKPELFGYSSTPDPKLDSQASKMWMENESNQIKARYRPILEDN